MSKAVLVETQRKCKAMFLQTHQLFCTGVRMMGPVETPSTTISVSKQAKLWGFLALHSIKLQILNASQNLTAANSK